MNGFHRQTALELTKRGHEVFVITPRQPGPIPQNVENKNLHEFYYDWAGARNGAELSSLKITRPKDLYYMCSAILGGMRTVLKIAKEEKPDYTLALWAVPAGLWAWVCKKIYNIPYMVWTLGSGIWVYGRKAATKPIIKMILRNADKLYSDGFVLGDETAELGGQSCGFLPTTRNIMKSQSHNVGTSYEDGKINFLFIGRYHINKGPDVLIEAINVLPDSFKKNCRFHIYGGGTMESQMKSMVKNYNLSDTVKIYGYADEKMCSALLTDANFLIIPSREDSIPVVLSDALQFHLPVIAAEVGDMTKLFQEYEIGYSFPKEDVNSLAEKIQKAVEHEKTDFKHGIDEVLKIFDLSRAVDALLEDIK